MGQTIAWADSPWVWALTFERVPVSDAKAKPILFSGQDVRAILSDRKTQTRRIAKPVRGFERNDIAKHGMPYAADPGAIWWHSVETDRVGCLQYCPYGQPGQLLWVREAWAPFDYSVDHLSAADLFGNRIVYLADQNGKGQDSWRPSIHMPRWACRIMLEITGVRVQRVQEISEEDARAEGCRSADLATGRECILNPELGSYRLHFRDLWDSINGKRKAKVAE
jgi:hypothetical protein